MSRPHRPLAAHARDAATFTEWGMGARRRLHSSLQHTSKQKKIPVSLHMNFVKNPPFGGASSHIPFVFVSMQQSLGRAGIPTRDSSPLVLPEALSKVALASRCTWIC